MRGVRRTLTLGVLLVGSTDIAAAHSIGASRFDAPLPLPLLYAGAGLTVAATAGWLAVSSSGVAEAGPQPVVTIPPKVWWPVETLVRYAFLAGFLLALAAGLLGPRAAAENVATVFVWPVWLGGLAIGSAIAGSPWRVLSPWRTLYRWLVRIEGDAVAVLGDRPNERWGWVAPLAFVAWIGMGENLTGLPADPRGTTLVVAVYAAVMVAGAIAWGEAWFERADAFVVLTRLFGRVAPLSVTRSTDGGRAVAVRPPWAGCTVAVAGPAAAAFVVAAVFTVSFDGFANTSAYRAVHATVRASFGLDGGAGVALYLLGLAVFLGTFAAVVLVAEAAGGGAERRGALLALAPTVLPIAAAYQVAHSYPYVVRNVGQLGVLLAGLVGPAPPQIEPLGWLSVQAFWGSQVALIVGGHVIAVVAAHAATRARYPTGRLATRAHLSLTALMVGYTVLSLWIVSQPVAT